jgi:hypothetical protein
MYILVGIFLGLNILLISYCLYGNWLCVRELALIYKQHILSPAEVRKVCYSLAELYVKPVYLNYSGRRDGEVHEIF